jgi:glycosyltransferase involved in cell wall biosynthesis
VNAPANRTLEHCREWVRLGHEVHVVTCFPSHPRGQIYPGYRLRWYARETHEGVHVHRVWTLLGPNEGVVRRSLNYLSFVPTSAWRALRLGRFDVIVATSPQFFCAVSGWLSSLIKRTPWVFELRDLWPESIAAVGAIRTSWVLRVLERLELHLYRRASKVVSVTRSFIENLVSRGIPREKIVFVPNGIAPTMWQTDRDPREWRARLGIPPDAIVAGYMGTVGMAHGVGTVLEAAELLRDHVPPVWFLVVGEGAEREALVAEARRRGLTRVVFTGQVPRGEIPVLMKVADIALVLLKDSPLFRTVLPSKLFEAMAAGRPIVLGVDGEARRVLEEAGAGVAIPPESARALADATRELGASEARRLHLGRLGADYVAQEFHRTRWARALLDTLVDVGGPCRTCA